MRGLETYRQIYFIGIGGIGMSALARYFKSKGFPVAGYDKTPSPLTAELANEGIEVHFEDLGEKLPSKFSDPSDTLVIYTPAIPASMGELQFVLQQGFTVLKRAQVLGLLTHASKGLGVAGTHGKTTTSTLLTHVLTQSPIRCNAFLGGIAANFNTNFVSADSPYTVIEADEFDRSFLQLRPYASIITSTDADHLDIYGDAARFLEGFQAYAQLIHPDGLAVMRKGLTLTSTAPIQTYAIEEEADFVGRNLRVENGYFCMDVVTPSGMWSQVELGLPGIHNAENALAVIALSLFLGLSEAEIRAGLRSFLGVRRRFEFRVRTEACVYIDDYAHHPTEINALVSSVRLLYPGKRIVGIFQPHLFSRTRDFMNGFAHELGKLDEVWLLPIYPAREEPIAGVTSDVLASQITGAIVRRMEASEVVEAAGASDAPVFLTIGAGDIDRLVPTLTNKLQQNTRN